MRLGPTELIIILVIVLVLFGPGRLTKTLGDLGKGLRSFKDGLSGDKQDETPETDETKNIKPE